MKLVICEKDMLARDVSNAVAGGSFAKGDRFPLEGHACGEWRVVAACGHLLELAAPEAIDERYRTWRLEDLPVAFEDWPKVVAEGRERRVEAIGRLLGEADVVYHAGDPDDEGQLIVDELLDWFGYDGPVMRVYVNDSLEKNIVKAFRDARDNGGCRRDGKAALARQMADAAFGFSETRLATLRLQPDRVVPLGRVQTPTLGRLVARDEEVEGHRSRTFYEVSAAARFFGEDGLRFLGKMVLSPSDDARGGEAHVFDRAVADRAASALSGTTARVSVQHRIETAAPPLPYNLTALQADMSKAHGYTAKRTMEITQSLRDDHSAITYNRTDCRYLKCEHRDEAERVLRIAVGNLGKGAADALGAEGALDFSLRPKCFDDASVTAHHAIIPQEVALRPGDLSDDEYNVYSAIVERYAAQFMRPATTRVAQGAFPTPFGDMVYRASRTEDAGWRGYFGPAVKDEGGGPALIAEGAYAVEVGRATVTEKKTAPPKRYTEGSLIVDMARIARFVEDPETRRVLEERDEGEKDEHGGIGTTATRAGIIDRLKTAGFAEARGRAIVSTELGRTFYKMLPPDIRGVDTTARWCLIQKDIKEGRADANALLRSVVAVFNSHRDTAYEGMTLREPGAVVGPCPRCGEDVVRRGRAYSCASNRARKREDGTWEETEGCGFKILPFSGHDLTPAEAGALLATGRTPVIKAFVSKKTGKRFDAALALGKDGSLKPVFPPKGGAGRKGQARGRSSAAGRRAPLR